MPKPMLNGRERRTLKTLAQPLAGTGWTVSSQTRCLDPLRARLHPKTDQVLLPGNDGTDLVQPGDLDYAFRAHFDFVVLDEQQVPRLAVEFDGPQHLHDHATIERDCRKHRLCFVAGLPLLRVTDVHLTEHERVSLLGWVVHLWQARHRRMPQLVEYRHQEVAAMQDWEVREAQMGARPDLDIEWVFWLENPFPPNLTVAARLHRQHRVHVLDVGYDLRCSQECVEAGTSVGVDTWPDPHARGHIAYVCDARRGRHTLTTGRYETASAYPFFPPGQGRPQPVRVVPAGRDARGPVARVRCGGRPLDEPVQRLGGARGATGPRTERMTGVVARGHTGPSVPGCTNV